MVVSSLPTLAAARIGDDGWPLADASAAPPAPHLMHPGRQERAMSVASARPFPDIAGYLDHRSRPLMTIRS